MRTAERAAFLSALTGKKLAGLCMCVLQAYGNASVRMAEIVPMRNPLRQDRLLDALCLDDEGLVLIGAQALVDGVAKDAAGGSPRLKVDVIGVVGLIACDVNADIFDDSVVAFDLDTKKPEARLALVGWTHEEFGLRGDEAQGCMGVADFQRHLARDEGYAAQDPLGFARRLRRDVVADTRDGAALIGPGEEPCVRDRGPRPRNAVGLAWEPTTGWSASRSKTYRSGWRKPASSCTM